MWEKTTDNQCMEKTAKALPKKYQLIQFKKFLNLDFTLYDRIVTCVMLCHYFSSEEIFNN
jgi:hypothetical protein